MDDLLKSLKAQLYDRVTSPLLGSFLISWLAWNHRLIVVVMSSWDAGKKFEFIDKVLYPTWKEELSLGVAYPSLSAAFLIFVYPIPARWVYAYVRSEQKKLKAIKQRIDDDTPVTQEEARELRAAIRKADADFEKEIRERNSVIADLRQQVAQLESEAKSSLTGVSSSSTAESIEDDQIEKIELNQQQRDLLREIAKSPDGLEASLIRNRTTQDPVLAEFNVDELVRHKLIRLVSTVRRGGPTYKATTKGRAFLVREFALAPA